MAKAKEKAKKPSTGHGAGTRGGEMFKFDPYDYVIIGLDTNDGPEHPLYDDRIRLPISEFLIRNIAYHGVLEPVLFERDGDRVLTVDGRNRIRAARVVRDQQRAAGEVEIEVRGIPVRGDEKKIFGISRSANIRTDITAYSQAVNASRMSEMGCSDDDIARELGVTLNTLKHEWLPLLSLAAPVRDAMDHGKLSATAAARLAKLSKEEQVAKLSELTANGAKPTIADTDRKVRAARGLKPVVTSKEKLAKVLDVINTYDDGRAGSPGSSDGGWVTAMIAEIRAIIGAGKK